MLISINLDTIKGKLERDFKLNESSSISRYDIAKAGIAVLKAE
jgi:hypothetical protein